MSSFKNILYVVYSLLFILTIVLVLYNESLLSTFTVESVNRFWMYWALLGFVLLMLESVVENIYQSGINRNAKKLARENNDLKARMYDDMVRSRRDESSATPVKPINPAPQPNQPSDFPPHPSR